MFAKLHHRFLATRSKSPISSTLLLYLLLDEIADALLAHREATSELLTRRQEHLRRIYHHTVVVQQDMDALVQIYFSANAQRTNEILQFLTVLSAVFLPLNLLAGLFGMNFTHLPLLEAWYDPWVLGGIMSAVVTGSLLWFRKRRWI